MPDDFATMFQHYLGNGVGISPNGRAFALRYDPDAILRADKFNTLRDVVYLNSTSKRMGDFSENSQATEMMAGLYDRMKQQGPPKPLPYDQYYDLGRTQIPVSKGKVWLY